VRYKGAKAVAVTPDYSEVAKLADLWLHPKQGTDAALAMAMGHVILNEFYFKQRSAYFDDYAAATPTCRCWCAEGADPGRRPPGAGARPLPARQRLQRQARPVQQPRVEDLAFDSTGACCPTAPSASAGAPKAATAGQWNLEDKEARHGEQVKLKLSVLEDGEQAHEVVDVAFPTSVACRTRTSPPTTRGRSAWPACRRCACA
jgi:nitrate reductase alpha subunit